MFIIIYCSTVASYIVYLSEGTESVVAFSGGFILQDYHIDLVNLLQLLCFPVK